MSTCIARNLTELSYIEQKIKIDTSINVYAIRAHIIKSGALNANLILTVLDGEVTLAEKEIAYSDINNLGSYFKGFISFDLENLRLNKKSTEVSHEYTLKLEYSGTNNVYLVQEYNDPRVVYGDNQTDGICHNDTFSPYGFEIYILN